MTINENVNNRGKGTKRVKAVFFTVVLLCSAVLVNFVSMNTGAVDIYEPDNSPAQATVIPTDGTSQSHDFDPAGDEDWVNFTVVPGTIYTIETLNLSSSVDTYMELYESDGITLIEADDDGGEGPASRIIWNSTAYPGGYCYVKIRELGGNGGPGYDYDIRIYEGVGAEFFPPHSDYGLDTDGDSFYNHLVLEVLVNVNVEGDYSIGGNLYNSSWYWIDDAWNTTFLSVGIQPVELRFNGWDINDNGDNGTYNITLEIRDESWNLLDTDTHTTNIYKYDEFQLRPAVLTGNFWDYGLDTDADTFHNFLVIEVEVEVFVAGNYYVEVDLHHNLTGSHINQNTSMLTFLATGTQTVLVYIDGMIMRQSGFDGPYRLDDVWLYDENGNTAEYLFRPYVTGPYGWSEFQPPPALFEPPHSDYGHDTDGDVLFNYLVVEVMVNVSSAGDYEIRGILYNSTWTWLETIYNYTYLPAGIQTVEIWFEGLRIYGNGDNGSYNVDLRLEDDSGDFLDSDAYSTNTYNYTEFQPPAAFFTPPHSDYGLHTDGDPYFNFLVVNAVVNVSVAGFYQVSAWMYDSSWNYIGYAYNYTFLDVGIRTVELRFAGVSIYNHGENGPFYVNLEIDDDSGDFLDSDTYTTNSYLYNEFQPPPAVFEPPHSDHGLDTDGDSYYNYLIVEAVVNVSTAGDYEIRGRLYDSLWNYIQNIYNYTFLAMGIQIVEIRFQGWNIYQNGDNGSYNVELRLRDDSSNTIDTDTYSTNAYNYTEFQPPPADFEPPHSDYGLDTDGDSLHNFLVVNVSVNVTVAGYYQVSAWLYDSFWNGIEYDSNYTFLDVGSQIVELRYDGMSIFSHGENGPYNVNLELRDDSGNYLDSETHTTNSYTYDEFQPPPAVFEPPHSDYGLDTDGDTFFNYLIVEVVVNVSTAGDYSVRGQLYDSSWNWIETLYNYTFLAVGIQTVGLRFEGWKIYNNGDNGFYNVELRLRDDSSNTIDTDTYSTNAYNYDEFQPPPAMFQPPHSDYGLDTDGDTFYNYLIVEVVVNVSTAGDYNIRGQLYDSSWDWIETLYNYTFLAVGIQTVGLRFEGWKIYNNGDNGSYNVELRLRDDSSNTLDTDTYSTNAYNYTEFQRPPAMFAPPHSDYGLNTDGDGYYNFLVVNVAVDVTVAGYYQVSAWLYDSFWNGIEYDSNYTFLDVGSQIVELRYDGMSIFSHGENGPYYVNLELWDDFGNYLDSETHTTNSYLYNEFQPPPAMFLPPHSDYGLDTDGDTYHNYLIVEVVVNVSTAGDYNIRGQLYDSSWDWIETLYNYTFLAVGIQTVGLRFEGWKIYNSGDNGSYNVELRLRDDSSNILDTDTYSTNAYNYTEFQRPPAMFAPPHSDYGLNTDGDGYYNFLVVNVSVNVTVAGNYEIEGYLYDSYWNWMDDDYNYTFLNTGIQIVELRFEGWRIYTHGEDGPYTVELNLYDASWISLDSDSHTTNFYTYDQFQPPPASLTGNFNDYGLNTDGDPYHNYLVIEVEVEVLVAGNYYVEVDLHHAASFNHITQNTSAPTFFPVGTQTISVYLEGLDIWMSGYDGPYILDDVWLYDDSWNLLDYLDDAHTTGPYSCNDFQPLTADATPPADVSDLFVIGTTGDTATLTWTAPGDDGMSGTATRYVIRYLEDVPITAANWDTATEFTQSWAPLPGGSTETHDVTGLLGSTQYWFAIVTADEVPNLSGVSNSPTGTTLDMTPPQISNVLLDGLPSISVYPGTLVTLTAIIDDSSTGNSDIGGANVTIGAQNWPGTNMTAQDGAFDSAMETATYSIDTTGLPDGSYDFYVYGWDEVPNYNTVSAACATLVIDSTAPANITDLAVVTTVTSSVTLTWTAPGDDDMSGTATGYEVRYSTTGPINDTNWNGATVFTQSWPPSPGGGTETHDVTGLTSLTTYWFAVKTADEVPTWSGLSNSPNGTTLADSLTPQVSNVMVDGQSSVAVNPGAVISLTATISDAMTGNSDILGANYTIGPQSWEGIDMDPSDGTFDSPTETVTKSVDTSGWSEGAYDLYVYGWDVIPNHNTASTAFATIIIDSTPPTSSVDVISQYWHATSPLAVTATASDSISDVSEVTLWYRFSEDGTSWGSWLSFSADSNSPWGWSFDFPDGEGHYEFYSTAQDLAENTESAPGTKDASCAYDGGLPTSSVDDILPFWVATTPLLITATANDDGSGLESVELYYRYSTSNITWGPWISFGVLTQTPFEWSFDFPEGEGYYQFYTAASDKAANEEGVAEEALCGYDVTSPTANAGSDQDVEEGDDVTFDGSGSSDNVVLYELTWTFEDGTVQTLHGVNPTYTFSNPGNYLVTLTVTDAAGNSNTDTMQVNVGAIPATGRITGVIKDENGDPISGATVSVEGTNLKAVTNATGHYTISNVPEGTYDLKVTKGDYKTTTISDVAVSAGEDTQNSPISMEKSPKEEPLGLTDYWWVLLIIMVIVVIILLMFLARPREKAPESFGDLEPMAPEPSEETGTKEPQVPSEEEQSEIPDETPPPEELPPPEQTKPAEKKTPPPSTPEELPPTEQTRPAEKKPSKKKMQPPRPPRK